MNREKFASHCSHRRRPTKDDELFMDYGSAWEEAWHAHVENWKPVDGAEKYLPSFHFNRNEKRLKATSKGHPYPPNVEIHVFEQFFDETKKWKIDMMRKVRKFNVRMDRNHTAYSVEDLLVKQKAVVELTEGSRPVDILSVEDMNERDVSYTIRDNKDNKIYKGLPRLAFYFFDKPDTTDMSLQNAFRHHIGIPDDVFPTTWRNLRPVESSASAKDEL